MMPNKAPNGNGTAPHTPSIAPHLRVKLSSPEGLKPSTNGHMTAAHTDSSQNGAAHHLDDQEQLYPQPTQDTSQLVQHDDVDAQGFHEAAEVLRSGSLQHEHNGGAPLQQSEYASENAAVLTHNGAGSAPMAPDSSAATSNGSGFPASMRSLQGSHVRGIVFDTETTGETSVTTISLSPCDLEHEVSRCLPAC